MVFRNTCSVNMPPIEGISEHPPISIVLGPLYFVLTYVFARPYLNEASAGATELLELWVLLTCTKRPSPFAASMCRNLQLVHDALVGHRAWTRPRALATRRAGGNIPGSC